MVLPGMVHSSSRTMPDSMVSKARKRWRNSHKILLPHLWSESGRSRRPRTTPSNNEDLLRSQGWCLDKGRWRPMIKGSNYESAQASVPTGNVNNNVQSFPSCPYHRTVIRHGISIRSVWLGLLWTAFASCLWAASAAAGAGYHTQLSTWWPWSNQSSGVNELTLLGDLANQASAHSTKEGPWCSRAFKCKGTKLMLVPPPAWLHH